MKPVLCMVLLVLFGVDPALTTAHAADYWVRPRGAGGDGSRNRPWSSLQLAADRVRPGDTVHVLPGDYTGFDLRTAGTEEAPIRFVAEGDKVRITRRNAKTPDGINIEGAGHVVIEGFQVIGMPRVGVRIAQSPHVTIRNVTADMNGSWGVFAAFCDDLSLIGNKTSNTKKEHGIYVSNSGDRPVVRGNVSWNNQRCGIHMNGDLSQGGDGIISQALVEGNILYGNGRGGGSAINADGVQDSTFRNNLIYDNHASGISLYRHDGGGSSTGNRIVNNTIVMPSDGRFAVNIQDASVSNSVFNNILLHDHPVRGSITISPDSLKGLRSDHNIVVDRFEVDGTRVMNLASWRSSTSQDAHSIASTPLVLFVDSVHADFRLKPDSPAINAGEASVAPKTDIKGHSRSGGAEGNASARPSIGAYERSTARE